MSSAHGNKYARKRSRIHAQINTARPTGQANIILGENTEHAVVHGKIQTVVTPANIRQINAIDMLASD